MIIEMIFFFGFCIMVHMFFSLFLSFPSADIGLYGFILYNYNYYITGRTTPFILLSGCFQEWL